jgi:hypothetical protein
VELLFADELVPVPVHPGQEQLEASPCFRRRQGVELLGDGARAEDGLVVEGSLVSVRGRVSVAGIARAATIINIIGNDDSR